jgi:hypothetical protein
MDEIRASQNVTLFKRFPNTEYRRLIVRHPYEDDSVLAMAYHEAAVRLASTYRGQADDDLILLPFLMLYRQAIELQLKVMIRSFTSLRRRFHDRENPNLRREGIDKQLRNPQIFGHNLEALMNGVLEHYHALEFDEDFPTSTEQLVRLLHEVDNSGTAFRYAGKLRDTEDRLGFLDFAALFDSEFCTLGAAQDFVEEAYSAGPQPEDKFDLL